MDYKEIGALFVQNYYELYNPEHIDEEFKHFGGETHRDQLFPLYSDETYLTYQDNEMQGAEDIMNCLCDEKLKMQVKHVITFSVQPSVQDGNGQSTLLIMAQGETWFRPEDENQENENQQEEEVRNMSFTELFFVSVDMESCSFLIHNQIFSTGGF